MAAQAFLTAFTAIEFGTVEELESNLPLMISYIDYPHPQKEGMTLLHLAAVRGDRKMIQSLLRFGSRSIDTLDEIGWSPLHHAVKEGKLEAVQTLISAGAAIANTDYTPMHVAATWNRVKIIPLLWDADPDPEQTMLKSTEETRTPLQSAIYNANLSAVRLLVDRLNTLRVGLGYEHLMKSGNVFHRAVSNPMTAMLHEKDVVETVIGLVQLGCCDFDVPNAEGHTPLQNLFFSTPKIVEVLRALGANSNFEPSIFQLLQVPLEEERILEIRQQAYFDQSLLQSLIQHL